MAERLHITEDYLRKLIPHCWPMLYPRNLDAIAGPMSDVMREYEINTPVRMKHFLAQVGHESAYGNVFIENLNYSAEGLLKTFPGYFKTRSVAAEYARNPERIANRVYANRIGNGDESSGDGWRFRGRGLIQLTGRANYLSFALALNRDCGTNSILQNPDLVAEEPYLRCFVAGWFWSTRLCNDIADDPDMTEKETVVALTRRINGGTNGLSDRMLLTARARDAIKALS